MTARPEEFLKKYHMAVAKANKGKLEKLKPRIASEWVRGWADEVGGTIVDREQFRERFEEFLNDGLGFAGNVRISVGENDLVVDVRDCLICPGNDSLKRSGGEGFCPITPTGLMAISRVLRKKAILRDVSKEGLGDQSCRINYRLEDKV